MLEEISAKYVMQALEGEIFKGLGADITAQYITHQGKGDLMASIPIKLKAWGTPNTYFIILIDQDTSNCEDLKREIQKKCENSPHKPLIRIICAELEAWYFGDLSAVEQVYKDFKAGMYKNKARYRYPDSISKPSVVLRRIINGFSKSHAAKHIPAYMTIASNSSPSFRNTVSGIQALVRRAETGKQH